MHQLHQLKMLTVNNVYCMGALSPKLRGVSGLLGHLSYRPELLSRNFSPGGLLKSIDDSAIVLRGHPGTGLRPPHGT